ncbi:hypothetical protein C1645_373431 [Glomus cerebriforme]|uniref:Uncharacterized protein n=1 Tax=Glomus cerebriforme TaxID=658196 RepID=A0A397TNW1_9GLOM|nr:hypothetical protein C1645_373431 [Glomus cerebriforme]
MNFLKFGARLFEQAYKELPNGIRQLCDHDDATKSTFTKSQQKVALVQPTLDGYVFSSGTIKQSPENYSFQLVGDLQDMVIVPTQSMDEEDIPTLGSILPKIGNHEFELPERRVSGVKFHKYKAYASFAPIYDSGAAMLSYEDTILARTYKKHHRVSKNIDDSDDSDLSEEEEEELSDEDMMVSDHEGTSQTESFDIALSNKQKHSDEEIGQAEKFETASPSKQTNSGEQISQAEKFEIASSSKQINSVEENSKTESIEIASSSKQNNPGEEIIQPERHEIISSSEEINQMEGLEIALSNKQTNSGEEIIQAEIHEITSNKPINSSEEINQMEGLKISSSSKQTNSGEEITQAESHENTPSSKQINSREEIIQTERHENNTGEEISQMEGLEITSSNRQTCSDEKISQVESTSSSKQTDSRDYIIIENNHTNDEKLFEDIDVNLLYKSVEKEGNDIDKILDENVEIFKKVQLIQEKRLIQSSHIISTKERELAIKLQNKLANIISEVSPSDIVSLDSIEYAMDNLLIKEAFFKGTLPPDKSFAHPTNEVSRDAFVSFSGVEKSSEDMEQAEYPRNDVNVSTTQMKSEEALPQVSLAGPSPLTPHSVSHTIPQSVSSQSLHHSTSHPLPISASMTYPQPSRAQVPMRMPYGSSQVMPASYQMTYSRPPSHVPPYYHHPSQRYHPSYGYSYYPQYSSYTMSHSTWQQRPSYY